MLALWLSEHFKVARLAATLVALAPTLSGAYLTWAAYRDDRREAAADTDAKVKTLPAVVTAAETRQRAQLIGPGAPRIDVTFHQRTEPANNATGAAAHGRLTDIVSFYQNLRPARLAITGEPGPGKKTAVYDTGQRLDAARLTAAVSAVFGRQTGLRARGVDTHGIALAVVDAPDTAVVAHCELPPHIAPADAAAWLYEQGQRVSIDPRREPLVRVSTLGLPEDRTLLAVTVHLPALDGRGFDNLGRTLGEAYSRPNDGGVVDDGFLMAAENRSSKGTARG
ncbi:hypothetical protein EAO69_41805 [Streptomyces sp. me109]|nr:hypothetical protein EAO69_41805 [Streptomyces sp. me109]